MAKKRLSELVLERTRPPKNGRLELVDTVQPGLTVRIGRRRVFVWRGLCCGRQIRVTLGMWPTMTIGDARKEAERVGRIAAQGIDPRREMRTARMLTVAQAVELYIEQYAKVHQRSWPDTRNRLNHDLVGLYGNMPVAEIGRGHIIRLLDEMRSRGVGVGANRTLAHVRRLFAWLAERELVDGNPAKGVSKPAKEERRSRVLSETEIRAIWHACDKLGHPYGSFVKLLILTGQRRGETAAIRWADLDLGAGTWTIPPELNKSGRPHLVHLSEPARALLGETPHLGQWVITTTGAKPINSFGRLKHKLDDLSSVTGWRLHDLRRTAATGMAVLRFPPHVVEKVLNHQTSSEGPLVTVYQKHDYVEERRQALEAWGHRVLEIVEGAERKVVPIRR